MTQYPEALLARELELCYANISLITDYDVGVEGIPPVTNDEVVRVFTENNARLRELAVRDHPRAARTSATARARPRCRARASRPDVAREPVLVTIEIRFRAEEDPQQLADRVRESVALIVGRENLEDFRVASLPLTPPKRPRAV